MAPAQMPADCFPEPLQSQVTSPRCLCALPRAAIAAAGDEAAGPCQHTGICYFRWTWPTTKALQTLAHISQAALEQQQTLRLQHGEGAKPLSWIWGSFLQPQSVAEVRSCPWGAAQHLMLTLGAGLLQCDGDMGTGGGE